jgi:hypothetical protein
MATMTPAQSVAYLLDTAGLGSRVSTATAWRIMIGRLSDVPDSQICVYDSGGQANNPAYRLNYSTIQVRVRGEKDGYAAAYTKANDISEYLNGVTPGDVVEGSNNGGHFSGIVMRGGIAHIGYDAQSRPEFTINFQCYIEPDASSSSYMHRSSL